MIAALFLQVQISISIRKSLFSVVIFVLYVVCIKMTRKTCVEPLPVAGNVNQPILPSFSLKLLYRRLRQSRNRKIIGVWRIGRVEAFCPKSHGFDSSSSRHVGSMGKSFTHSYLWRFGVKLRHSIRALSVAPLSSSGLEEALQKWSE